MCPYDITFVMRVYVHEAVASRRLTQNFTSVRNRGDGLSPVVPYALLNVHLLHAVYTNTSKVWEQ